MTTYAQNRWLFEAPLTHKIGHYTNEFEWESQEGTHYGPALGEEEWEGATSASFVPIAVERPGGGRIQNKKDPNPADVVIVKGVGGKKIPLHRLAAAAWQALVAEARTAGISAPLLLPVSGYRSSKRQNELWQSALQKYGSASLARQWVAPPGSSAHESGRAIDFYLSGSNSSSNVASQRKLPVYRWLVANAERFGFYPYPKEPWHWEYNPPDPQVNMSIAPSSRQRSGQRYQNPAPGLQLPSSPATAPALIRSENQPPGTTLYVDIRLGQEGRARPMTGIFIPEGYRLQAKVDILLYLPGFKAGRNQPDPGWSIDWYWRNLVTLREDFNNSHKSLVLAAPTLGKNSQTGWLIAPGGLDRYLNAVMAALSAYGPYQGKHATVGNIILACHSGGGTPMGILAQSNQQYSPLIRECWGFDCMYNGDDASRWGNWARQNPNAKLYNYYRLNTGTAKQSEMLQRLNLSNVSVVALRPEQVSHYGVVRENLMKRLTGTKSLHNTTGKSNFW